MKLSVIFAYAVHTDYQTFGDLVGGEGGDAGRETEAPSAQFSKLAINNVVRPDDAVRALSLLSVGSLRCAHLRVYANCRKGSL